jgi:hypothetical protein
MAGPAARAASHGCQLAWTICPNHSHGCRASQGQGA